ncbi:MAG: TIGR01777 family oxidoreductase [Armatimonadetes bacterium]|nr:TIGR01777 family oxidoreductase [Armatimonadota bacterium]MDW8154815.1 TIGR01777 family oxidoreductase [Armatimonadota bacterium]
MRIAITGASGLLGTALAQRFRAAGHEVVPVGRDPEISARSGVFWDPPRKMLEAERLEGVEVVVNLAGARIAPARWTPAYRALIRTSRVEATRFLCETLARLARKPRVLLSASAVGYYGNRDPQQELDESSPPGEGFLARLCVEWEAATEPARSAGIRTVLLRTGTVLTLRGGFLPPLVRLFRVGLGGRLGRGDQVLSWIALVDYVRAVEFLLQRQDLHGPVNLTAPKPVTNAEFTATLARILRRPAPFRIPAFALRLAFGRELAEEVFLAGQRVVPRRLWEAGFRFDLPELEGALRAVLAER